MLPQWVVFAMNSYLLSSIPSLLGAFGVPFLDQLMNSFSYKEKFCQSLGEGWGSIVRPVLGYQCDDFVCVPREDEISIQFRGVPYIDESMHYGLFYWSVFFWHICFMALLVVYTATRAFGHAFRRSSLSPYFCMRNPSL
jgi:hypothetical protein